MGVKLYEKKANEALSSRHLFDSILQASGAASETKVLIIARELALSLFSAIKQ